MEVKVAGVGIIAVPADWVTLNVSMVDGERGFYIADRNGVRTVSDRRVALDPSGYDWVDQSRHTYASGEFK